jgi:hypothetical protein
MYDIILAPLNQLKKLASLKQKGFNEETNYDS